jgi:gamma-glutamyltranspeptidase/glutathione hydrolase
MTTTTPDLQEMHTEFEAAAGTDGAPDFVHRPSVLGRRYMISSVHYHATMGGLRILEQGGNAIDAGVAAGICLNVVEPQSAMFGGVAPIVVFLANGADDEAGSTTAGSGRSRVFTVSGLGRWPQAASLDDYLARYGGDLPAGVPRTVTPGAPDAWLTALARFGTLSLAEVLQPALELAREGFPMWPGLHESIASAAQPGYPLTQWPSSAAVWMPGGRVPAAGEIFRQPDLASTFQRLINAEAHASGDRAARIMAARDLLYRGELAQQIASFYQEEGSILTAQDLAEFAVKVEPPAHTTYRGYDVYSCGPWCQGPTLLQALNLLEGFDLPAMGRGTASYLHTVAEALDLAFADRERYYGDPDLIDVPLAGLLSKDYAAARRELIREGRVWGEMPPAGDPWSYQNGHGAGAAAGDPPRPDYREPEADTAYVCVVDADGNTFSATPSDGIFGSPIVPGLGFAVSSRGTQTWLDPQHASRLQPWKRPRLTPNPALALRDGHSFMPFGCPGGDQQVQGMLQVFLNVVEFGLDPQAAIESPRICSDNFPNSFWPHVYHPGRLNVETRVPAAVREQLAAWGHKVYADHAWGGVSRVCAIVVDPESGTRSGGADPRAPGGHAAGW